MDEKEKEFNKDNMPADTNETDTSLSEMKRAVDKSIEEQEDTLKTMDELSKKYADDKDMKDIAKDLSDIAKIDKRNINNLKDFKQYIDLSTGVLNITHMMSSSLMDVHSKFMNETMYKDDLMKTYFEEIFKETDKDDKSFYKIKRNDKFYTIKEEFLTQLEDGKYIDNNGIEQKVAIRDMKKIQDRISTLLGDTPATRDLLHGCDIMYNEINNLIFANFSEEKMIKDTSSAYNYFFQDDILDKLAHDIKKEIEKEISKKEDKKYNKEKILNRRNLTNTIITKINKTSNNVKHGQGYRFIKSITDFAFIIAYINELDIITEDEVLDKLENVNDNILVDGDFKYKRYAIETILLKNIKSHILDKKGITYIPALVYGMTVDITNNPMLKYSIKIVNKLKEVK